jgi:hypothetical protein
VKASKENGRRYQTNSESQKRSVEMEEKKRAEIRRFLSSITDPEISAFIDLKKLCKSEAFGLTVQMATEHAATHHDFTFLERILTLLEGSVYVAGFIAKLRPTLNFIITETKPRKFKKATQEQVAKATLQEQQRMAETKKTLAKFPKEVVQVPKLKQQDIANAKRAATKPAKKIVKGKGSRDLMDSWLMLPGGYGTGRRR